MAKKRTVGKITWAPRKHHLKENGANSGFGSPSVYHALIIIFLEFFAWGLLTSPIIMVLNQTFPNHTFLLNGLIQGVKGMLSFLSAPLIGALSDVWGRKIFLLLTVTFTCLPIPLISISPMWYFTMLSLSGLFSVTFSVVFAYVADITSDEERGQAYGLVSATFAASLVTSPALGAYLENAYSDNLVVWLATAVAVLDVLFILLFVPESLPEKIRPVSYGSQISWEQADPFGALKRIGADKLILLLCCTVFLSYLPEAGEYSSFFVYLRLVMNFSAEEVASYIALVGVLSVIAQTLILTFLMRYLGHKASIMFGLVFEISQLICYGFGSQTWIIWMAGCIAAMSSVTYPAISAFASEHAAPDQQGAAQGLITGIRGLCNGLGPAVFGCIFYLFGVDLNEENGTKSANTSHVHDAFREMVPGPPFAFGAILVIMAFLVAIFIPEDPHSSSIAGRKKSAKLNESFNNGSGDVKIEAEPLLLNDNNL
ncbi:hippocampus abundant transcript 1 protein-like [Mytilus edulis]|uniref:hippocampus abundant transcript 1 protein-like n=1 Tax=Mytilus edulis TaxID=6550 RepID=UPI0039EF07DD